MRPPRPFLAILIAVGFTLLLWLAVDLSSVTVEAAKRPDPAAPVPTRGRLATTMQEGGPAW